MKFKEIKRLMQVEQANAKKARPKHQVLAEHFVERVEELHGEVEWFAVTLTFRPVLVDDGELVYLNDETARKETQLFLERLNKNIFKGANRKYGKRLCSAGGLERGLQGNKLHSHLMLEKPERFSEDDFRGYLEKLWDTFAWANEINQFEPLDGEDAEVKWATYVLKDSESWDEELLYVRDEEELIHIG